MIGLYYCPHAYAAQETGLTVDEVEKLLLGPVGQFVSFDPRTNEVLVHRSARHNIGIELKAADNRMKAVRSLLLAAHSKWLVMRFMDLYPEWPIGLPKPSVEPPHRALNPGPSLNRAREMMGEAPLQAPYLAPPEAPSKNGQVVDNPGSDVENGPLPRPSEGAYQANAVQCSAMQEENTLATLAAAPMGELSTNNVENHSGTETSIAGQSTGDGSDHTDAHLMGLVRKWLYHPDGKPPVGYNEARDVTCIGWLRSLGHTGNEIAQAIEGLGRIIRDSGRVVGDEYVDWLKPSMEGEPIKATMRALINSRKGVTPLWQLALVKYNTVHKQDTQSEWGKGEVRLKIITGGE
jgi:hypothetical protein